MSLKGKLVYNPEWERNPAYKQYQVSYCLRKMNPGKKCKKSLKSPGILFSYFCMNPVFYSHVHAKQMAFCHRLY